jgi:glycosyltransferase involved in cell wall biosynthesis
MEGGMNICILAPVNGITVFPAKYGGIERMIGWLAQGLVKLGHNVTLIAQEESEVDGVRVEALEPDFGNLHKSDFLQADMADALIGNIDCFHDITHDKHFARRHMRDGIPFIATHQVHSRMGITTNEVCISIAQREHMKLPDYVPVVYNGVPTGEYEFQPDSGKYLLFMGALTRVKGLDNAINIAWLSGWPLKMAGIHWDVEYWDNEITPMLEDEKSKLVGVEFVGEVGGEEKMDLLKNAYAFLYPLRWLEPGGIVVTEALACGVPILGTDSGVLAELVEHNKQGYLVSRGSPRGIVDLASLVPQVGVEIDRAECRARAWWFHSDIMAKDYAGLYDAVAGGGGWEA